MRLDSFWSLWASSLCCLVYAQDRKVGLWVEQRKRDTDKGDVKERRGEKKGQAWLQAIQIPRMQPRMNQGPT